MNTTGIRHRPIVSGIGIGW